MPNNTVRYSVTLRNGLVAQYAKQTDAIRRAIAEVEDGWPSSVRDMVTDIIVWSGARAAGSASSSPRGCVIAARRRRPATNFRQTLAFRKSR